MQLGTLASELQGKYCRCDLQQPNNNLFLYQRVINIVSNLGNLFISIHSFVPNRMSSNIHINDKWDKEGICQYKSSQEKLVLRVEQMEGWMQDGSICYGIQLNLEPFHVHPLKHYIAVLLLKDNICCWMFLNYKTLCCRDVSYCLL
mgnify:CR=1 FL=1